MSTPRIEGDQPDLARQIDDGIRRGTLLRIDESAYSKLQAGRLPERLAIFSNRPLLLRAIAVPELADQVLTCFCSDRFRHPFGDRLKRDINRLDSRSSFGAAEHFHNSQLAVQAALTELAATTTNPEVRAKILAVVCRNIGRVNYYLESRKTPARLSDEATDFISQKIQRQLEELTRIPQPYAPSEMGHFLDNFGDGLTRADWEIEPLDRRDRGFCAMFFGSRVMERAAATYFPSGASQLDVEEFFADTTAWTKTDFAKAAISGYWDNPLAKDSGIWPVQSGLWDRLAIDESLAKGRNIDEYVAALFDEKHPNHSRALRIIRKLLIGVTESDALIYAKQLIEGRTIMAEAALPTIDPTRQAASFAGRERYKKMRAIVVNIIGQEAGRTLDIVYGEISRNAVERPEDRTWLNHVVPSRSVEIKYDRFTDGKRPGYLRITQVVSPDTLRAEQCFAREAGVENEHIELDQLTNALIHDVQESRVALVERTILMRPDVKLTVTPKPSDFPACDITLVTDNFHTTLSLDNKLSVGQSEAGAEVGDVTKMMRALAVAVLHDQLSYSAVTGAEASSANPATSSGEGTEPPVRRPVRVHHADRYIIMTDQPEDPAIVSPSVRITGGSAIIHVERRPHWSDRAPQLTRQARELALEQFKEGHPKIADDVFVLMQQALTQEDAHRLTVRRILTDLYDEHRHHKRLLPADFPLAEALDQLPALEEEYYAMALGHYVGSVEDKIPPQGPLPRLYTMAERMDKDRQTMAKRGLQGISIPPRQRPTETYVSSTQFEVPLTFSQGGIGRGRGYTVIEAQSATQALTRLLKLPESTIALA